ncbi:hypothetical protein ACLK2H_19040 [Escherichia coli]
MRWSVVSISTKTELTRATQAMRQVGWIWDPFLYTAAMDKG